MCRYYGLRELLRGAAAAVAVAVVAVARVHILILASISTCLSTPRLCSRLLLLLLLLANVLHERLDKLLPGPANDERGRVSQMRERVREELRWRRGTVQEG